MKPYKTIKYFISILCLSILGFISLNGMEDKGIAHEVELKTEKIVSQNQIVYLISNPRASMVELLRWAGNNNNFKVMHIPANYAYCHANNFVKTVEGWYRADAPTTYEEAMNDISKEADKSNVFVGENTHTVNQFLPANPNFMNDPRVKFLVLIRELHGSTIDYYMQKKDYFDTLPEEQMSRSLGFEGLYNLLLEFRKNGKGLPLIISSEDLANKTDETVKRICDYLNIPFKAETLKWNDISKGFKTFTDSLGWYTIELTDCSLKWHEKAIKSTGFTHIERYAVADGKPTFEEIENLKHREICQKAYEENLVYYNKIQDMIKK